MSASKGGRPRAGSVLTPDDIRVIDAWLDDPNIAAIARALKMSEGKVTRTLALPLVKAQIDGRTAEMLALTGTGLKVAVPKALEVMIALLDDSHAQMRYRAAAYVLDRLPAAPQEAVSEVVEALDARLRDVSERLGGHTAGD